MAKNNLKQQAYSIIKEKIMNCEFAPGMFLNEEILCETVHTSRTPVREAVSRLEQEGLISVMPKRGIVISELTLKDVNMIFELRLLLEPYALKQYGPLLSEEELLYYYQFFSSPYSTSNSENFFEVDSNFHLWIINSSKNKKKKKNYELLHTQNLRFRILTGKRSQQRLEDTCKEHLDILDACLKKDWEKAAQTLGFHLQKSKNCTFDLLLARQLQ